MVEMTCSGWQLGWVLSVWPGNGHDLVPAMHLQVQPQLSEGIRLLIFTLKPSGAVFLPEVPTEGTEASTCSGVPYL